MWRIAVPACLSVRVCVCESVSVWEYCGGHWDGDEGHGSIGTGAAAR